MRADDTDRLTMGAYVTYQGMVEYVTPIITDVRLHAATHDAWHLSRAEADAKAARSTMRANIMTAIAAAAVVVAAVSPFIGK